MPEACSEVQEKIVSEDVFRNVTT